LPLVEERIALLSWFSQRGLPRQEGGPQSQPFRVQLIWLANRQRLQHAQIASSFLRSNYDFHTVAKSHQYPEQRLKRAGRQPPLEQKRHSRGWHLTQPGCFLRRQRSLPPQTTNPSCKVGFGELKVSVKVRIAHREMLPSRRWEQGHELRLQSLRRWLQTSPWSSREIPESLHSGSSVNAPWAAAAGFRQR
jgi:hypothetical protein